MKDTRVFATFVVNHTLRSIIWRTKLQVHVLEAIDNEDCDEITATETHVQEP